MSEDPSEAASTRTSRPVLPNAISPDWVDYIAAFPDPNTLPERPGPDDTDAWSKAFGAHEKMAAEQVAVAIERHSPALDRFEIDGVPILEI